jgi:hypothetical protein
MLRRVSSLCFWDGSDEMKTKPLEGPLSLGSCSLAALACFLPANFFFLDDLDDPEAPAASTFPEWGLLLLLLSGVNAEPMVELLLSGVNAAPMVDGPAGAEYDRKSC